ncbi:TPA: DUF4062 domain-containing protein [Vibrio parahaemolyticus]|uniref:DUF4062 domain-containing protein n=1 Tax=Vibrio parahaemolyticus TaxID=670 RepID=UPI002269FAB1|nr:DUF4062 domain-containing protein [Vibrio parahaemolyticus]MCX8936642.1 DUF4062 domain-containing protein [Vibrio parahaemolyticus]HCG5214960.1 DUF4062 domain-containing protein [Vibrio parahaemolyticus]
MASPKVFVSSTCFDLGEVREQLRRFIRTFGFEPVLSEHGEVFFHPDLHTHDSCVHEVSNCQIFILIIGGRFGGEYVADTNKSITNAEYEAAKRSGIPIFTYVRNTVLSNHHVYTQNKEKDISYPAIEQQKHAKRIFGFIDDVRRSPTNNAFEGFDDFQDIESHLRKQWAGLFYELLRTREVKAKIDATNHILEGLSQSGKKLEELVKSLYIASNEEEARREIGQIEIKSKIYNFLESTIFPSWATNDRYGVDTTKINAEEMSKIEPREHSWFSYLEATGLFVYDHFPLDDDDENDEDENGELSSDYEKVISYNCSLLPSSTFSHSLVNKEYEKLYEEGLKNSTKEQRFEVFQAFDSKYGDFPF